MTEGHEFARMDQEYREGKARIRADEDLTYEAKERKVRELGLDYDRRRKEAEKAIADRLEAEEAASYRKAYGPGRSTLTAEEETARELRLIRIRSEVTDDFEAGRQDPLVSYQQAVRAGDMERAEVIGKVGAKYLQDPIRRRRLAELVGENEPEERRRAKKRLAELEAQKRTHELGSALHRNVRSRQGLSFAEIAGGQGDR